MSELLYQTGAPPRRLRRRRRRSRALRVLAVAMIAVGTLALADALVTVLWQEPLSALYATLRQDHLSGALRSIEHAAPTTAEQRVLATLADEKLRIAYLAERFEHTSGDGSPVGRITIPSIGASFVVVKGTDTEDLKSGPGIYPETSFPGAGPTTAIAGHRTTYLAPFRHIDALRRGSVILLRMPYAEFAYSVMTQRVVSPTDVQAAVAQFDYTRLVLSACTPLFSAEKRLLVFARLERTTPLGAARRLPGGAAPVPIESVPPIAHARREHLPRVFEPFHAAGDSPLV